ncbi:MAG TPA: L,D-transpeptidase family protein [Actinomycetota bacterium]
MSDDFLSNPDSSDEDLRPPAETPKDDLAGTKWTLESKKASRFKWRPRLPKREKRSGEESATEEASEGPIFAAEPPVAEPQVEPPAAEPPTAEPPVEPPVEPPAAAPQDGALAPGVPTPGIKPTPDVPPAPEVTTPDIQPAAEAPATPEVGTPPAEPPAEQPSVPEAAPVAAASAEETPAGAAPDEAAAPSESSAGPKLPKISLPNVTLPKISLPKSLPRPKIPEAVPSWAVGAGLFVVLLLIYGLIASLAGGKKTVAPAQTRTPAPAVSPSVAGSPTPPVRACAQPTYIATVATHRIAAHKAPNDSSHVIKTFGRKSVLGAPQVFLVQATAEDETGAPWLKVLLPVRPNGTAGYVPATDVTVAKTFYRIKVVRNKFSLWFYQGCKLVRKYKVGIGAGETPTPVGDFYLQALYKLPVANSIYGTYAYALSGYSDVITDWKFGGIIGLHGTNDPTGSIGHYVSHGCIRMRNQDIESLVKKLPLGTPIEID